MTPDDDPGWPRGPSALVVFLPGGLKWYLRRHRNGDGLFLLRQLVVSFSMALVIFAIVLIPMQLPGRAVFPWLPILAALAVVSLGTGRLAEKPLDCSTDERLASTYRMRFFLRIAFAESIALFGFVFAFMGAATWIYDAGAAVALVRFWTAAAPTSSALARDQQTLHTAGCSRSLVAALREPPGRDS